MIMYQKEDRLNQCFDTLKPMLDLIDEHKKQAIVMKDLSLLLDLCEQEDSFLRNLQDLQNVVEVSMRDASNKYVKE